MQRRTLLALTALAALAGAAGLAARTVTPPSVVVVPWKMDHPQFGGWSGIDVSPDGRRFWAVGDRGSITKGELVREAGQLVGVVARPPKWIKGETTPSNRMVSGDAEGISVDHGRKLAISYELFSRVWRYDSWRAQAERIHQHPDFPEMVENGSLEALATLPDGSILTLPELPRQGGAYPVFIHDGSNWTQPFALERDGHWRAVGADVGPDERLYLLERQFIGIGFISQIRRFDLNVLAGTLTGETLYRSPPGRHDNLEGLATWQDDDGFFRAVMVSDDNFLPFLRSEIVEVILPR